MNDPLPTSEPAEVQAPAASESAAEGNFGAALRAAREAAGITVPTLASRLRLHVRQIEALERSDLSALPTLIYVRGFVRSCARELKIDVAPLLEDLDRRAGVVTGAPLVTSAGGFHMARLGDGSRSIVAIAVVGLVVAGIIGTLWPRRANLPSRPAIAETPVPAPAAGDPGPAAPATDAAADAGTNPGSANGVQAHAAAAATPPAITPAPSATPVPAPATPQSAASQPAAPKASAVPPGINRTTTAAPARPADARAAAAAAPVASAPAPNAVAAAEPAAPVPSGAPAAAGDGATLVLRVHAASWVEVVQANGTSVFSQICPAGSVQTLHAEPPLRIVVGNAAAVDAQYRGNAIDLNRYANANGVARFTLQ